MKKQSVLLVVLVLISCASWAQDSVTTISRNRYANLDFSVGYMNTDLGNINGFLSSYGYKTLQEDIVTLSFAPSYSINRFVIRAEYTWQFPSTRQQSEDVSINFTGRYIAAYLGYLVIQKPNFRLYPYVGLTAFTSQLVVREKTTVTDIDDLVNNTQQAFHLAYSNAGLDVGFQADKLIPLKNKRWDCPQNVRYMTVGIRAGYLFGPGTVKGRFNNEVVEGAPTYSLKGPYIKLVIGFSTKMRDLKWKK
ncbi:MAG TPA: hypothetical protein VGK59_15160 [Ohtaekwangia sp.]